jgi:hypothetical protein
LDLHKVEAAMPSRDKSVKAKADEAKFLADQFDLPGRKAAGLVADDGSAEDVSAEVARRQRSDDSLEDVPTPKEPRVEHVADVDEVRLKPVLHRRNERSGGA